MSLEGLKNFKAELLNPERQNQFTIELAVITLASLITYVSEKVFNNPLFSAAECLVGGLSCLVLSHFIDAAALTAFKGTYTKKGAIQCVLIGGTIGLAVEISIHVLSKLAPSVITNGSRYSLTLMYAIVLPIAFKTLG